MTFRYARKKISSGETLTVTSRHSTENYAAIFVPGTVGGLPATEILQTNGQSAKVTLENGAEADLQVVIYLGTGLELAGTYLIESE